MRQISNFGARILSPFLIDIGGFISFGVPRLWSVFELGHYGLGDLIIVQITHCEMEIFSSFFSDYHFAFLYPEPWDNSIRSTRYVPSSPPSYNTFYRSAEQFEISLLNPDGNGYLPSR